MSIQLMQADNILRYCRLAGLTLQQYMDMYSETTEVPELTEQEINCLVANSSHTEEEIRKHFREFR